MKKKIREVLFDLGIPASLDGFEYAVEAIDLCTKVTPKKICVVYVIVADRFNTKDSSVERCIKHALSRAKRETDTWQKYVGIDTTKNAEILYNIAYKLSEELEDE